MNAIKLTIGTIVFVMVSLFAASCSNKKALGKQNNPKENVLFKQTEDVPCMDYDTDDYYVGQGISSGPKARMGELQTIALTNAQNVVRQKLQHAYKGAVTDAVEYKGNNSQSDFEAKMERRGIQIITKIVNDTRVVCGPKFSGVDEKGDITCYVGIRVYKKEFVEAVTKSLADDEELKDGFDEKEFRKQMDVNSGKAR